MVSGEIEDMYRTYGPLVLRRARAILRDEASARDAMQEVFIRVIHSLDDFKREASPMTWLYRITTNHCLNQLRNQTRRAELLELGHGRERNQTPGLDDRLAMARVLAEVAEELGQVAVYYYLDDLNQDEIAELLGTSRRTVGNRLEEFRTAAQSLLAERVA